MDGRVASVGVTPDAPGSIINSDGSVGPMALWPIDADPAIVHFLSGHRLYFSCPYPLSSGRTPTTDTQSATIRTILNPQSYCSLDVLFSPFLRALPSLGDSFILILPFLGSISSAGLPLSETHLLDGGGAHSHPSPPLNHMSRPTVVVVLLNDSEAIQQQHKFTSTFDAVAVQVVLSLWRSTRTAAAVCNDSSSLTHTTSLRQCLFIC